MSDDLMRYGQLNVNVLHPCAKCGERKAELVEVDYPSVSNPDVRIRSLEKRCRCGHTSTVGEASGGRAIEALVDRAKQALL